MKKILFFIFLLVLNLQLIAQVTIQGTVKSVTDGSTLPGVSILLKGTTTGTVSDLNGHYSITVPKKGTLVFSYIGFKSQEIAIANNAVIDVILSPQSVGLNQLVVIGYGTVKKSDLTGSVSSVKGSAFALQSSDNPVMALQGRASGVRVIGSGQPGTSPTVQIRGIGTIGNSSPLYVVDGMMVNNILFLNNNDIASVEILKDASATAIYGSRGANGVILITTKKGSSLKPTFSFNYSEGIEKPFPFKLVTAAQYGQLINEGNINEGKAPAFPNPKALGQGTDWYDAAVHSSVVHDYQLSFNQKTKNSRYYISVGYHGNPGIVNKSGYNRYTIRLNNQYDLTKKISIGHNVTFVSSHQDNMNLGHVFGWLYRVPPTEPVYDQNGAFNDVGVGSNGNVPAAIYYTHNYTNRLRAVGNAYLNINFLKDFTFKSSIGINMQRAQNTNFIPVYHVGTGSQKNNVNSVYKKWSMVKDWIWENTITYDKTFGLHHITFLAGYTAQKNYSESLIGTRYNLFAEDPSLWYLNAGATDGQTNANFASTNAIASWLTRVNYSYQDKYLITVTMRSDASSRFPKGQRTGYFPSAALAWNLTNESFIQDLKWVSYAKIRASWGKVGNDKIGDFRYFGLATTSLANYAIFNNMLQVGSSVTGLVNTNVTWETSESKDIGFNLGLFNNKFHADFDYYSRVTKGMLVDIGVPETVGFSATEGNVGSVENKGIDMKVSFRETRGDFRYSIGMTGTTINNKVLDLGTTKQIISGWNNSSRTTVGEPIGYFYGYKAIGVFQNQAQIDAHATQATAKPGDLIFADLNHDGVINAADRTKIGSPIPKFMAGTNLMFGYKSFELMVDMYGSFGNDILNVKAVESYSSLDNFTTQFLGRWHGSGTSNTIPRITYGGQNKQWSTRWVENGSFWKIQTVRLSYNITSSLLKKVKIAKAQIYLDGENLHYFTKYHGSTPEISSSSPLVAGIDRKIYPMVAYYTFGAIITF